MSETVYLTHGRIQLALHRLKAGEGPVLLLLHGLGERSPSRLPSEYQCWPGSVHALDFTGHGQSTVPRGGGYTPEGLQADADAALAHLGPATVVGRGLGAYVAVLLAGARPELVNGAILRDGSGLGGAAPGSSPFMGVPEPWRGTAPDPLAIVDLATDLRPPDYAVQFAQLAAGSNSFCSLSVCASERVPWLGAILEENGVEITNVAEALSYCAPSANGSGSV